MFSDLQWECFRLTEQEGLNRGQTARRLNLSYGEVCQLLEQMKGAEPDLFPVETELENIQKQLNNPEPSIGLAQRRVSR